MNIKLSTSNLVYLLSDKTRKLWITEANGGKRKVRKCSHIQMAGRLSEQTARNHWRPQINVSINHLELNTFRKVTLSACHAYFKSCSQESKLWTDKIWKGEIKKIFPDSFTLNFTSGYLTNENGSSYSLINYSQILNFDELRSDEYFS